MGSGRVSVVVPARNAEATLPRALEALAAQELGEEYEVVVVDAGSTDRTAELVEASGFARLVGSDQVGPAHARNLGAASTTGDLLAFTDADCFPEPGWLAAGVAALQGADLVQGAVHPDRSARMGPFDRSIGVGREIGLYETANLLVRREAFDRVGGFKEWLAPDIGPPHMAEDILFGWEVRRAGGVTRFCADSVVQHAVFPRNGWEFVAERRRERYFPDIARTVPELRETFFYRRWFLSRRSALFDLALVSLLLAAVRRSPLPLAGAAPYVSMQAREARRFGKRRGAKVAAVRTLGDAVGCYSLLLGSIRRRTPLL